MAHSKSKRLQKLKNRDGLICKLCGGDLTSEWEKYEEWRKPRPIGIKCPLKRNKINITVDHKTPISLLRANGVEYEKWHALDNLQLAHKSCNHDKGSYAFL